MHSENMKNSPNSVRKKLDTSSVTVIHPQAMYADAYATTIMVLGGDAGLALAERLNLAVLIIEKSADGAFVERYTPPMLAYFVVPAS